MIFLIKCRSINFKQKKKALLLVTGKEIAFTYTCYIAKIEYNDINENRINML